MSINHLIHSMEKLLKLHKSLLELAIKKTEILESEDIKSLNQLLKEEQAHVLAIEKIEAERRMAVEGIAPVKRTMSELLQEMPDGQRGILADISEELQQVITKIQQQNELNQNLITQTLKFINFSISLVTPPQEDYNYGHNEVDGSGRSLFSSKA